MDRTSGRKHTLPLNIVIHVHQVSDALYIIGDIGITVDRMLDGAAGHCKVDHIHRTVVVDHGINQSAGECIAAAYPLQEVERKQPALKSVSRLPQKGL